MYLASNVQGFAAPIRRYFVEKNLQAPVIVVGGSGGSGTRLIVQLLQELGVFMGIDRNASEDAMPFVPVYDHHINRYLAGALDAKNLVDDLLLAVISHLGTAADTRTWGWKNPRSIYLLPLLDQLFSGMLFIHVVRDGLTMSTSHNQAQLEKHGELIIPQEFRQRSQAERSLVLWSVVNVAAANYGVQMGNRYLLLRYEDVCDDPAAASFAMAAALRISNSVNSSVQIRPRRVRDPYFSPQIEAPPWRIASTALKRFGYPC